MRTMVPTGGHGYPPVRAPVAPRCAPLRHREIDGFGARVTVALSYFFRSKIGEAIMIFDPEMSLKREV